MKTKKMYKNLELPFCWQCVTVPGAGHENEKMISPEAKLRAVRNNLINEHSVML